MPFRRSSLQALSFLALAWTGGCGACPFLAAKNGNADTPPLASSATTTTTARRHLLASAYPSPSEAFTGFLPGTLGASMAAIAKTLAPQTSKPLAERYLHAVAGWKNVTAADGDDDTPPQISRLEAAILAVEESLKAGKGTAAHDAWDGSLPDAKLAFAEELFTLLMYPIPPSLFVRLAFHDCGSWNKGAAAIDNGGAGGAGPKQGGCNGSVRFELGRPSNYGLGLTWPVINFGWKVLEHKFPGTFSRADAVAIAGAGAVRASFGPVIHVGYGRVDAYGPDPDSGPAANPQAGKDYSPADLQASWLGAWGLSPSSLCALLGAHTFGISSVSVPLGAFAPTGPILFTNTYYRRVVDGTAHFPLDNSLGLLPATAACVREYAADQDAFFGGFAREYRAMSWWGTGEGLVVRGIVGGAPDDVWREPV